MPERHQAGTDPVVIAHVIGQSPRPDLSTDLERRLPSARVRVVGALDGIRPDQIAPCAPGGYPLETRLRDGSRVVLDADFVAPLLQQAIDAHEEDAAVHLVLCAGPFPDLAAPTTPSGRRTPLIQPFDTTVVELVERGFRRLDVMVPFASQAAPAVGKWVEAGFTCRAHVLADQPSEMALPAWVSRLVGEGDAEALVFDYVGFPSDTLGRIAAQIEVPVLDVGRLALDVLDTTLSAE
jgi:hypothetical protein